MGTQVGSSPDLQPEVEQVGLVQQALGFPQAKLGEGSMGFAKSWMRNVIPRIFSAFLPLLAPPVCVQAGFVWVTSPRCPQGDEDW